MKIPTTRHSTSNLLPSGWPAATAAALSAVERLVILRPTDVQLQILRAEILVNLGNDTLALGELEALAKLPLLADQKTRSNSCRM